VGGSYQMRGVMCGWCALVQVKKLSWEEKVNRAVMSFKWWDVRVHCVTPSW